MNDIKPKLLIVSRPINTHVGKVASCFIFALALSSIGWSAEAEAKKTKDKDADKEDVVVLSKYVVTNDAVPGYGATRAVGGSRFATNMIDTASSISVVSQNVLKDLGSSHLYEVAKYISGIGQLNGRETVGLSIRGMAVTSGINGGIMVNGLPDIVADPCLRDNNLYEQIEVIKGPAGSLYGAHSFGGIVNYVLKDAQHANKTSIRTTFGERDLAGAIDTNGSLSSKVDYRVIIVDQDSQTGVGGPDVNKTIYGTVKYRPTDNLMLWARIAQENSNSYGESNGYFDGTVNSDGWARTTVDYGLTRWDQGMNFFKPYYGTDRWNIEAGFENRFVTNNAVFNFRLLGRYREVTGGYDDSFLLDGGLYNSAGKQLGTFGLFTGQPNSFATPGVVAIGAPKDSNFLWIRQNYYHNKTSGLFADMTADFKIGSTNNNLVVYTENTTTNRDWCREIIKWYNTPDNGASFYNVTTRPTGYVSYSSFVKNTTEYYRYWADRIENYGYAFGIQNTMKAVQDKLLITTGARFDSNVNAQGAVDGAYAKYDNPKGPASWVLTRNHDWSKKASVLYKMRPDLSVYVNYATTFVPTNGADAQGNKYENQYGICNEIGIKTELLDGRLTGSFAYFDNVQNHAAVLQTRPDKKGMPTFGYYQGGEMTSKGWETDFAYSPTKNLALLVAISNVVARDADHKFMVNAPEGLTTKFLARYSFSDNVFKGLDIGWGLVDYAKQYGNSGEKCPIAPYTQHDLFAHYKIGNHWKLGTNIYNAANSRFVIAGASGWFAYYQEPRNIRFSAEYTF